MERRIGGTDVGSSQPQFISSAHSDLKEGQDLREKERLEPSVWPQEGDLDKAMQTWV